MVSEVFLHHLNKAISNGIKLIGTQTIYDFNQFSKTYHFCDQQKKKKRAHSI